MAAKKDAPASLTFDQAVSKIKSDGLRIGTLAEFGRVECESLSTGNMAIDYVTGVDGLPLGRIVELYGPPSCGKTTTALQAAARLQQRIIAEGSDEHLAYFDFEHALDAEYCRALGLNPDHPSFILSQPDSLEQGGQAMRLLVQTGSVRLLVTDSVAAMTPQAMFAPEGSEQPGLQAKQLGKLLSPLNSELHTYNCCAVFLNHEKEVIEMGGFGPKFKRTYTPGGKAMKYYASLRLQYQQLGSQRSAETDPLTRQEVTRVTSTEVRVRVSKNKVGPPFRETVVRVRFGKGFDDAWTALEVLKGHKRVVVSGAYHYFEKVPELVDDSMGTTPTGRRYIQGAQGVLEFADGNPAWREALVKAAKQTVDSGEVLPDEPAETPSLTGGGEPDFGV